MPNGSVTLYKLIILYTLSKVDAPLPPDIISDYIISHEYTNYFTFQNALGELLMAELIQEKATYHLRYYKLTESGRETLSLFGAPLSPDIRKEIDAYLEERKYQIIDEISLVSDYKRTHNGTYMATCVIQEKNHTLFRLELDVTTESDAIKVCENWKAQSETLYQTAIQKLLSKGTDKKTPD